MEQNNKKAKKLKIILIALVVAIIAIVVGYKVIEIIKAQFLQPLII